MFKRNSKPGSTGKNNDSIKKGKWSRLATYKKVLIIVFSAVLFIAVAAGGFIYFYIENANKTINSGTSTEIEDVLTPGDRCSCQ